MREKIAVIGATGSVGASVLDVCAKFPEYFDVVSLAANSNEEKLLKLGKEFAAKKLCLSAPGTRFNNDGFTCYTGTEGLSLIAEDPEAEHIVFASSGTAAIPALQAALRAGKKVSLANKESIVVAGPWVMPLVKYENQIRPIDSEHSAVWQCMEGCGKADIDKIWLTASGGPFRDHTKEQMATVKPEDALKHPTWNMGAKITVDSATLMNKGIECIEAAQLFGIDQSKVGALVHPSSLVHGLVRFIDGATKLLMSRPDMRLPAASAIAWPRKLPLMSKGMDALAPEGLELSFRAVDLEAFPCFRLALDAGRAGGAYPALLVGADEAAVNNFLLRKISFTDIARVVEKTLSEWKGSAPASLEDAIKLVDEGSRRAEELCGEL